MKLNRKIFPALLMAAIFTGAVAQVESGGGVRRRSESERNRSNTTTTPGQATSTDRLNGRFESKNSHEADLEYQRTIYRFLDLEKPENTPLYFPEDVIDGQENLFRLMFRLVVDSDIPAYEYLDGREVFSDKYKIDVKEMLDRFDIYYTSGGAGKNSQFNIDESDVPTNQVNGYYIIEKWEFDRRTNQMRTFVDAICPVLTRIGDFGGEARYPMFWVKFDALRPYLAQQYIFLDDDNNLARYSLDDYFNLGMYNGDIYKYQNLRNLSMMQMYPEEEDLKRAQDSIDRRLKNYVSDLWVPTRDEYLAQKAAEAERQRLLKAGDTIAARTIMIADTEQSSGRAKKKRSSTKASKVKQPKVSTSSNNANSSATKSVRNRKK